MKIVDWSPKQATHTQIRDVAALNIVAYPRYYFGLHLDEDRLMELSARLLNVEGGEISRVRAAVSDAGQVAGFTSFLPEKEFDRAVARTAFETIKFVQRSERQTVTNWMKTTGNELPKLAGGVMYLSRIAVSEDIRGTGLGERLLQDFHLQAENKKTSLHVDRDNKRAIAFYRKNGYRVTAESDSVISMCRACDSGL